VTLPSDTFAISDVYAFARELEPLPTDNSDKRHREQVGMCKINSASNFKPCVMWDY
jgi:hypothetical protein